MNGFTDHGLSEGDFSEPKSLSIQTFDAFPKTKPTYLTKVEHGSTWTWALILASLVLIYSETSRWFSGTVNHAFAVEKGVSHQLQLNVDLVVRMRCDDLHVNVQDAAGDRILAADMLKRDPTNWAIWVGKKNKKSHSLGSTVVGEDEVYGRGADEDVHDYLGLARKGSRKFKKTPRVRGEADSCRLFGSLEGNKVQGDFHITARGHGYMEFGMHLDHSQFNFSHHVNELSFGPYYPSLINPLDNTVAETDLNFFKFQYYCSIVPTIYTTDVHHLQLSPVSQKKNPAEPLTNLDPGAAGRWGSTIWTNQYAVTSQSHKVPENRVPGIFFKYDIEPILLVVNEQRGGFLALVVRLVNVVSGILVAGAWFMRLSGVVTDMYGKTGGGRERLGFLGTRDEKFV